MSRLNLIERGDLLRMGILIPPDFVSVFVSVDIRRQDLPYRNERLQGAGENAVPRLAWAERLISILRRSNANWCCDCRKITIDDFKRVLERFLCGYLAAIIERVEMIFSETLSPSQKKVVRILF